MGGVDMGDCRLDQLEDIAAGQGARYAEELASA
jgi:hypothetical protein